MDILTKVLIVYILIMNITAFLVYGIDKRKAKKDKRRISEASLLLIGLFGGSLGSILGMHVFHHKTKKWKFKILVPVFFILHIALFIYLYFIR